MKFFYDFLPLLAFFVTFKVTGNDIYPATVVAIVATFIQVLASYIRHKQVEFMQLLTLGILVVFGGATLLLHNEMFIKWKPTVVYWLLALLFLGSHFVGRKLFVQRMLEKAIELPANAWRALNIAWFLFFGIMGIINLVFAYRYTIETWATFKVFGSLALTALFVLIQGIYLVRIMSKLEEKKSL